MTPLASLAEDWPVISALLDEALALPPDECASWLEQLSGDRLQHREALRALLAHRRAAETDDFLRDGPWLQGLAVPPPAGDVAPGERIGSYRLVREIGQGGMGTVWLAERVDGLISRRVALKLPRMVWGRATAQRLAREREILAALEHEHIARLYDAGVDGQGRPFLAMEYIEGQTLDAYCRLHACGIRERIALLLQVMAAVAHAHTRLVVHRDLKPGNILVTARGQVKLLDFGIGKLLSDEADQATALTRLGGRAMTPDYASPEQIRGEPLGTASDIYSLGVVAYELLSGAKPYRLKRASMAELEEAIASADPPLASASAADARVARALRGDLDAILHKALKKAAAERYATMEAFADDLRRHLDGDAVQARPDGLGYRAAKFLGRHRLQVAAASVVAVTLLCGASVALWQAREARAAAATAQAVQGFLESVFKVNSGNQPDPVAARGVTARELLDRGAQRIDSELAASPRAQLRLYDLLAEMYENMALYERSLTLYQRERALATRVDGADSDAALSAAARMGYLLGTLGRPDEALTLLLEADATARGRRQDRDLIRMLIDTNLAGLYFVQDPAKGLERARHAAAIARRLGPSLDGITALHALGENAVRQGQLEEARLALTDALAWIDAQPGGAVREAGDVLSALGDVHSRLLQPEQAAQAYARALKAAGPLGDPVAMQAIRLKMSRYQFEYGLLREAVATSQADHAWVRSLGPGQGYGALPARILLNRAQILLAFGDAEQALAVLEEARSVAPSTAADFVAPYWISRANVLITLQRLPEAGVAVTEALGALQRRPDGGMAQNARRVQRRLWWAQGDAGRALSDLDAAAGAGSKRPPGPADWRARLEHARLWLAVGQHAAARGLADETLAEIERAVPPRFSRDLRALALGLRGEALLREGQADPASEALERALAMHLETLDASRSAQVAAVRSMLAHARRGTAPDGHL